MVRSLLIVDDNAAMRRLIKTIVEDLADDVHECPDGAEALAAYSALRPEVVLMDIEMPRLDGLSATRDIVREFPEAEIIILTKYESPGIRRESQNAGARGFVMKENLFELRSFIKS